MFEDIIYLLFEYWYFVTLLIIGIIAYAFWTQIKNWVMWNLVKYDYPVSIIIFKKRGRGMIRQLDKGKKKRSKEDGTEYYDTVKNGKIPRLDVNTMTADNSMMLWEFRPHEFKQIDINDLSILEAKLKLEPMSESSKAFHIRNVHNANRYKKQDALSKYGTLIIMGLIIIGITVVIATQIIQPLFNSAEQISKDNSRISEANLQWWRTLNATISELGIKVKSDGMEDTNIKPPVNASPIPY